MKVSEGFREEYTSLNTRITEAFKQALDTIGKMVFYEEDFIDDGEISDDDIPMYQDFTDCPNTYYIDNNGNTIEVYVTKIDSEGIHIVEAENYGITNVIDYSELDGIHCKLEVLEMIA